MTPEEVVLEPDRGRLPGAPSPGPAGDTAGGADSDDEDLPPVVVAGHRRRTSPARLAVCLLVVGAAVGFLLWKGLGNATVYFKTADEAVAQQQSLAARRFRVEGVVLTGSVVPEPDGTLHFTIYGDRGATLAVVHSGGQPGLFRPEVPVVLEGHLKPGATPAEFVSDTIIVKHSESYKAANPDRVKDYNGK
jgi:cytochrome c-type biogenesis protein CcmE